MKNSKNNFRKIKFTIAALFICFAIADRSNAQTYVAASNSDYTVATVSAITGLNSAVIYDLHSAQIQAFVYYDAGSSSSNLYIYDAWSGNQVTRSLSHTPISTPDVIIGSGNNNSVSDSDFQVAVAYADGSGEVVVDYFNAESSSAGTPTYLFSTSPDVTSTYSGNAPSTVHIDGVSNYSGISYMPDILPTCRYAFVTWDDGGAIYAAYIDLQSSSTSISAQLIANSGTTPDVAGIQRIVSSTPHDMALITYLNGSQTLDYIEWDYTASSISSITTIGSVSGMSTISAPRIDAIDDYQYNSTGSGNSYYKVAAAVYNALTGYNEVRTYDNLTGTSGWASSGVISWGIHHPPPYNNYAPAIAMSGPFIGGTGYYAGSQYVVSHFQTAPAGDMVMMEPIDYSTYNSLFGPPYDYYGVNNTTFTSTGGVYVNSASTTCNYVNESVLFAWAYPNSLSGYDIKWRLSPYAYSFKHGIANNVPGVIKKSWQLYPNPANSFLILSCASIGTYEITDLIGLTRLNGAINGNQQQINLGILPPGNYILKTRGADGNNEAQMFVKE
jgi:hypothetical protein